MLQDYNIKGVILQPFYENVIYEGIFKKNLENQIIEGELFDVWGLSSIEGNLLPNELNFNKSYRKRSPIKYQFKRKGNLWVGTYQGNDCGVGESLCEIVKLENKFELNWEEIANNATLRPETVEEFAKFTIQKMVEEGYIKIVKDEKTGEECIIPVSILN